MFHLEHGGARPVHDRHAWCTSDAVIGQATAEYDVWFAGKHRTTKLKLEDLTNHIANNIHVPMVLVGSMVLIRDVLRTEFGRYLIFGRLASYSAQFGIIQLFNPLTAVSRGSG